MTPIDWVMLCAVVLVILAMLNPPTSRPPSGPFDHMGYQ